MAKRYANLALVYGIAAMVFGVFYREFTKFSHFSGKTNLSVMHTHYFMLGMFFFLMLMVIEKVLAFSDKGVGKAVFLYQVGLNNNGIGFLVRVLTHVWGTELRRGMDASISGTAGIGHILIGGCMVVLLVRIRKAVV